MKYYKLGSRTYVHAYDYLGLLVHGTVTGPEHELTIAGGSMFSVIQWTEVVQKTITAIEHMDALLQFVHLSAILKDLECLRGRLVEFLEGVVSRGIRPSACHHELRHGVHFIQTGEDTSVRLEGCFRDKDEYLVPVACKVTRGYWSMRFENRIKLRYRLAECMTVVNELRANEEDGGEFFGLQSVLMGEISRLENYGRQQTVEIGEDGQ